jgi:hypothetical protein
VVDGGDAVIVFTGNRGVPSKSLAQAALDLAANPDLALPLLSHTRSMEGAVELMNRMVAIRSRHIDGELIMRLIIEMNPELIVR